MSRFIFLDIGDLDRGVKQRRLCGLLGAINLLSPE
jgi:hypothetical protein